MQHYEYIFRDNTALKLVEETHKLAKAEVLHLRFCFKHEGRNMVLNVPLWDGESMVESLRDALSKYLGQEAKQGVSLEVEKPKTGIEEARKKALSAKECEDCGELYYPTAPRQKFCNDCREKKWPKKKVETEVETEVEIETEPETENISIEETVNG